MVRISATALAALLLPAALGAPSEGSGADIEKRQGYYFQNWSEGGSNVRCSNGQGGSFSVNWNSKGGFVCGKGWSGGGAR